MLLALILLSLFFTMLLFPETVFQGACDGLLLWYQILIPTLFPYLIVTGLLLKTDGAAVVSRLLFRPFHLLFGTSFYGSFAVLSGFLCGRVKAFSVPCIPWEKAPFPSGTAW